MLCRSQRAARADVTAVAVVVLNWNGADDTIECLESLGQVRSPALDVLVVDNASSDDSVVRIRASHPGVVLLRAPSNLGFSAGNNLGVRAALERGAERVLILNNDTIVDPLAIASLNAELDRHPSAGAACPLLTFDDPADVVWFAGATFDATRGRSGRMTGYRQPIGEWVDAVPRDIDRGVGAAMLVRREVIEEVGMLDDGFFFLYEDVDWSLRMRAAGWGIRFVPHARVVHKVAASHAGREVTPTTLYYLVRNHMTVCERFAPLRGFRRLRRHLVSVTVLLWSARRSRPARGAIRAVHEGWRDFRLGRLGPRG